MWVIFPQDDYSAINLTHLRNTAAEPLEHGPHVTALLHGDHPNVVLLVNPNQEVLLVIVPESYTARLITSNNRKTGVAVAALVNRF